MRRAYSAHAVSAQAGSLAATATTCSLATRALLGGFPGLRAIQSHGFAAPDFLEVVKVAHGGMHDVHHHVAEVHQHPFAVRFPFDAVHARAVFAHLLLHIVGERFDLPRRITARDDHA